MRSLGLNVDWGVQQECITKIQWSHSGHIMEYDQENS